MCWTCRRRDVFADVSRDRAAVAETLLTRAPEAILEVRANNPLTAAADGSRAADLGGACVNPFGENGAFYFLAAYT